MKYSVIFLQYDPDSINTKTTMESYLSILDNSDGADMELIKVIDVKGFVNAVNGGLSKAKGDYLIVVANDIIIKDKNWLEKMAVDDALCGWRLTPFFITGEMRPDFGCWSMSRKVFEKIGLMDKKFENGYGFDDDDYVFRAKELGIKLHDSKVKLTHLENMTYKTVFKDLKEEMTQRNESLFRNKWSSKIK